MTGIFAAWPRKVLIASIAISGCLALFLVASATVKAEQIVASWYGPGFEGATTASGEPFDPYDYTAASKTYEFGTRLIVTYEGRSVVVRVTDRGPYVAGRSLDLSQGAAEYLGLTAVGVGTVNVEVTAADTPTGPYGGTKEVRRQQAPQATATQPEEPVQNTQQAQQRPAAEAEQAAVAQPEAQTKGQQQEKARQGFASIGQDQYASEDQYQEEILVEEPAPPAPPAPKPAVPVLPPEPEPAALEAPPVELAVPNSTIERRVELDVAAPPAPVQPTETTVTEETVEPVQETPEPAAEETVKPVVEEVPEPVEKETSEPVVEEASEPVDEEKPEPKKSESKKSEATGPGGITVLPDTGGAPLGALFLAGGAMLLGAGLMVRIIRR